ncbi:MAG: hypothetical protein JWN72_1333 [Thermoleophilia bacterium]|nr:hypothetical protein [Thermoleophilia bacterium]
MLFTILFMYAFVFALVPFIAFCLHQMHTGDQMRDRDAAARVAAQLGTPHVAMATAATSTDVVAPPARTAPPAQATPVGALRPA